MAGKPKSTNSKADAGRARKAEQEAKKKAEEQAKLDAQAAKEWEKGANLRKASREDEAARKADEAAQKRREKAELLAAEEAELGQGGSAKKAAGGAAAKKKNKKKGDLALLEDALQSAADKKVRKKKEEVFKKQEEEKSKMTQKEEVPLDPLLANTEKMIGVADEELIGRQANIKRMEEEGASGIDAALSTLNVSGGPQSPPKSAKALYNEFEARMLPQIKEEYPGLRLSQLKEKVWALWKKSPENPANQVP